MLGVTCIVQPPTLSGQLASERAAERNARSPVYRPPPPPSRQQQQQPPPPPRHDSQRLRLDTQQGAPPDPATTSPAPPDALTPTTEPLLLNTASAARWRRKGGSLGNINVKPQSQQERPQQRQRALSVAVPVPGMEQVHGVDVSWLHKPNKDQQQRKAPRSRSTSDAKKDGLTTSSAPPPMATKHHEQRMQQASTINTVSPPTNGKVPSFPNVTPPTPVEPSKDTTPAYPTIPTPSKQQLEPQRPRLFSRGSSERTPQEKGSKRASWMNSLGSKFSQTTPDRPSPSPAQSPPATNGASQGSAIVEDSAPYTPSKPKESSSFFSSFKRSLSSSSQTNGLPKVQDKGVCPPRRILNVDPNRERCDVPEMDPNRLRRVSFCVDVEIAGGPRYVDDDDDEDKTRKRKENKLKERAEGEALKHPETLKEEKDENGEPELESKSKDFSDANQAADGDAPDADVTEEDKDAAARKREKKKQSEAERKERKEKRRRRAEESGSIPVELPLAGESGDTQAGAQTPGAPSQATTNGGPNPKTPPVQPQPNAHSKQDRPTTDPVRIYRRCCQLRESPILKRITEQLMHPKSTLPHEPGVVACLDLTGSRLQLADVVTLGDWLAVVPVKHLKVEDADLSDEGVRCILAGLLAAKRPEPTKRKSVTPKHREGITFPPHQERSGVIEKITFKNNPRLTRVAWKYISLFIYMCRSLRAIDLSMNQFPDTLPPSAQVTPIKNPANVPNGNGQGLDAAEALYQCLSERRGGTKLEELIMSECDLTAPQIKKIVHGVMASGIRRLGLAGNHIDDESLGYILEYLRTGACQALDVGSNDLRGKLAPLAEAIVSNQRKDMPHWGLCLSDCNLDTASLKPLFAALAKLPSFRFLDLSHNRDLCKHDNSFIDLLAKYMRHLPELKRIHLSDVSLGAKQAISLSDILNDAPMLAHISILENPELTALANAKTEADQEEACALYASLMTAVRVSGTIICVDVDVPSPDNSEVVQALAKQVVAYSLRNMENFALVEESDDRATAASVTAALTAQHGGESSVKNTAYPKVLMSLVGHVDDIKEIHDHDEPAPDDDYIVGGTGVVKALQCFIDAKATNASPSSPRLDSQRDRVGSSAELVGQGKAKEVSKNLLNSARKIRDRLQPALIREMDGGNDIVYRRLQFLDQTLQGIIERFEEEYPETRLVPPSPKKAPSVSSSLTDHTDQSAIAPSIGTQATEPSTAPSDDEEDRYSGSGGEAEDEAAAAHRHRHRPGRQNSDVNLQSRAQMHEEGRLHRMGMAMKRDIIDSPALTTEFKDVPWKRRESDLRFGDFANRVENLSGADLRAMLDKEGYQQALKSLGGQWDDLRHLQEEDPEAWELFVEAQEKARLNVEREAR